MPVCWIQLNVVKKYGRLLGPEKLYAHLLEPIGDWEKYACFLEPI